MMVLEMSQGAHFVRADYYLPIPLLDYFGFIMNWKLSYD
jgi:hypothetical protein